MKRYPKELIVKVKQLRKRGKTYGEIKNTIKVNIPKSTLSEWGKNIELPANYRRKISQLNITNLNKARRIAVAVNKIKREKFLKKLDKINKNVVSKIKDKKTAKIALAMLCLGEASKYNPKTRSAFSLGSSNPKIIIIFLELLKYCFSYELRRVRCTVQCRADQNIPKLERYWKKISGIPDSQFYKARIDPRTIGKPTKKLDYKGVLKVDYLDTKVQLELESLADLIYNTVSPGARSLKG